MADRARGRALAVAVALVVGGLAAGPASASAVPRPAVSAAGALPGEWWWDAMGVDELQAKGRGEGITVAVIDTPIDPTVPELAGKVASTTTECLDPTRVGDPRPRSSTGTGPEADHATSMAALIAGTGKGTGPGGRGIRGIAPDATIRHYGVLYRLGPDEKGCGLDFPDSNDFARAVGQAIATAAEDGADVINLSLVSGYSSLITDGLLVAYREGAIVVAGTGNTTDGVEFPGVSNGVVLVNPVGKDGKVTDFAVTSSPYLGLAAPGEDVMAGVYDETGWHSTRTGSGASIATALVSGGIADVWSAHPDATAGQVLQAVRQNVGLRPKREGAGWETWFRRSGTDIPQVRSRNTSYGWGIFAPADAVLVDPTTLPRTSPFVRSEEEDPGAEPAASAIAVATDTVESPSPSDGATPVGAPEPGAVAAPPATDTSTLPVLLGVAALVLVAGGAGAWVVASRRRPTAPPTTDTTTTDTTTTDTTTETTSQGATGAEGRSR